MNLWSHCTFKRNRHVLLHPPISCYIHPSPQSPSLPPFLLAQTAYTYLQVYVKLKSDDHKLKEGTKVLELNREYRSLTDTKFSFHRGGVAIFWINQWEGEDWTIKEIFTNQGLQSWSLTLEQVSEMFTNHSQYFLSLDFLKPSCRWCGWEDLDQS